jgi:elongator complex protein 1
VGHVLGLSPTEAQLSEAGSLSELLVMLGHEGDARTLQGALSAWQAAYQVRPKSLGQNKPHG